MIQQQNEKLPQQSQNFLLGKERKRKNNNKKINNGSLTGMETFCILYQMRG